MKTCLYEVGELTFALHLPEEEAWDSRLQNYRPFSVRQADDLLFQLSVLPAREMLPDTAADKLMTTFEEESQQFRLFRTAADEVKIEMTLSNRPKAISYLVMADRYASGKLYIRGGIEFRDYVVNNAVMILYAFAGAFHHRLLQHASVIKRKDEGYLFLGKSGTGKSTHSRLWLRHVGQCELLNDDNPVIGLNAEGIPTVYGTPWSGKTPCYKNEAARIGGFVQLWQAPENKIAELSVVQAYAALLPTVSSMKWDRRMADAMNETLNALIAKVPVFSLNCLPDEAAAELSFHALTGE